MQSGFGVDFFSLKIDSLSQPSLVCVTGSSKHEMSNLQVLVYRRVNTGIQLQRRKPGSSTQRNRCEKCFRNWRGFWCGFWHGFCEKRAEKSTRNPRQLPNQNPHRFFCGNPHPNPCCKTKNPHRAPTAQSPLGLFVPGVCSEALGLKGLPENALNWERVAQSKCFGPKRFTKNLLRWCVANIS